MSDILAASQSSPLTGGPSFTLSNRLSRAIWSVCWLLLASWTPPAFYPWRRFLLKLFGARLGRLADVRGSARVWHPRNLTMGDQTLLAARVNCYNMAMVTLETGALVSQGAHLCGGTHDIRSADFQLVARPIVLGAWCWVATEAFVGPGVTVGEGAVLGARGVASRDLDPWTVYAGNPAAAVGKRDSGPVGSARGPGVVSAGQDLRADPPSI